MYKVFSGKKCAIISSKGTGQAGKDTRTILFRSAEELHKEYTQFARSSALKNLVITGNEEQAWRVFRSLFSYIEAAGGVVKNEKGHILMIYRNHHWDLPKGRMEKGETPDQSAIREVQEECGVTHLKIVRPLASTFHIFSVDKEFLKQTYWYEMICKDPGRPKPQTEEGIKEAKWMTMEEVKKISGKIYPSLQDVLFSAI